eukprot:365569-Chlamydomonas_euryale.AAC.8
MPCRSYGASFVHAALRYVGPRCNFLLTVSPVTGALVGPLTGRGLTLAVLCVIPGARAAQAANPLCH